MQKNTTDNLHRRNGFQIVAFLLQVIHLQWWRGTINKIAIPTDVVIDGYYREFHNKIVMNFFTR